MTAAVPNTAVENEVMIELRGVNKWYDKFHVLKDINLQVAKGERIVQDNPDHPSAVQLTGVYHNLLRRWAEV